MGIFSAFVAVVSLFLAVALVPVIGAVMFSLVLFGLFMLALVGVVAEPQEGPARGHERAPSPNGSRAGTYAADGHGRLDREPVARP